MHSGFVGEIRAYVRIYGRIFKLRSWFMWGCISLQHKFLTVPGYLFGVYERMEWVRDLT